jgi:ERCC4-type nuclease
MPPPAAASAPIELFIDNREHTLIEILRPAFELAKLPPFQIKPLDVGDIQIWRGGVPYIIIERKTIADLASSLASGRYREQKARLLSQRDAAAGAARQHVIYLIEGQFTVPMNKKFHGGFTETAIMSTLTRAMFKDGLHVIQVPTATATASWIQSLYQRLVKEPTEFEGESALQSAGGYAGLLVGCKRDNVTPDICFKVMLAAIPGVSAKCAESIAGRWPTMAQLCTFLTTPGAQKILEDLSNGATTSRRIGPVVSKRIVEMLTHV